jgi:hypothetical protein
MQVLPGAMHLLLLQQHQHSMRTLLLAPHRQTKDRL